MPKYGDEVITARILSNHSLVELLTWVPRHQPHYPTYYLLIKAWLDVTGLPIYSGRLLSAVAGITTIILVLQAATEWYDRETAWIAGGLLACSPLLVYESGWLRMYALLTLVSTASIITLVRASKQPSWRRWLSWLIFTLLLVWMHPFGFFLFLGELAYVAYRPPRWILGFTFVALASIPGLLVLALKVDGHAGMGTANLVHLPTPPGLLTIIFLPFALLLGRLFMLSQVSGILALGLPFAIGGTNIWRSEERAFYLAWIAIPVCGVIMASYLIRPIFELKYLAWIAVPIAILVARGLRSRVRVYRYVFLGIIVFSQLVVLLHWQWRNPWIALHVIG